MEKPNDSIEIIEDIISDSDSGQEKDEKLNNLNVNYKRGKRLHIIIQKSK